MRTLPLMIALLMPISASAQSAGLPSPAGKKVVDEGIFTPHHVAKLRFVTEAVISPNGTQIAYALAVPRDLGKEKDGAAWTELHVVDTKGNSTPFIAGPVNVSNITWTPNGKDIAFLAKRGKDAAKALYLIGGKGGESRKVVEHGADILGFSFNGDGSQIAFLATEPTSAAKKKQRDQGFSQEIYEEDAPLVKVWLTRNPDAIKVPPAHAPGFRTSKKLDLTGSASELHWNPKEDKLAVALAPSPSIDDHIMFRKVHIVDLKTNKATNLNNPGKLGQIAWSPDGKKLAIITGADKHDPKEGQAWVHGLMDNGWTKVSANSNAHVDSISWVDPTHIMFLRSIGVESHLDGAALKTDGSITPWLPFGGGNWYISSNLSSSSKIKRFAYIAHTQDHPPEVMLRGTDDADIRRLTNSNPWLKDMKFAKQEVIKYKAKDGLELEGILIYPLNYEKGKRYPLVLTVHGGPEAHYSNGWLTNYNALGQVAAAKGMAVFYPNYRGSTGYGVEFSMKGQKEAAGKEFDDLIDGVDHLVKIGLVDEKKVGITGGSYGGYATAWCSTYYSHRFAAGVMFVGLSDLVSCAGTTDIPQEMYLVHHRKWLWEDWDYFKKASPISHVDKHKTSLLIMHGKADPRVHPSQSLELYRHLKVRNQAPVRLVLYPGEGHGNRRAASRLDYNIRALQWMEHYLKGPGGAMPAMDLDYGITPATKTSNAGWDNRRADPNHPSNLMEPWLGRGCPCCIGW